MTTAAALVALNLIAVAEAAALPVANGFEGDDQNRVALQAGSAGAAIGGLAALRLGRERILEATACSSKYLPDPKDSASLVATESDGTIQPSNLLAGQEPGAATEMASAEQWMLILGASLFALETVESLNGFGSPDPGSEFHARDAGFASDIAALLATSPQAQWSGRGADAYDRHNTSHVALLAKIAEADHRIAGLLKRQAAEVEQARSILTASRLGLMAGLAVCGPLYALYQSYSQAMFWSIAESIKEALACAAKVCIFGAIPAAIAVVSNLANAGVRHGNRIDNAARDGYHAVIADLQKSASSTQAAQAA